MTVTPVTPVSVPYSLSIKLDFPLHPPPEDVGGFPTREEVHSYPVMFSWDDLKDIIRTSSVHLRLPAMERRVLGEGAKV